MNEITRQVRAHAGSAALGAALMIFFGFFYVSEPSRTDLFGKAAFVFIWTLRMGGVLTAVVTLWLATGHRPALFVDAVLAVVIGLLFIGTGLVMLIDGGHWVQSLINLVFGSGFISAGLHSWRNFVQTVAPRLVGGDDAPPIAPRPVAHSTIDSAPPPNGYLAALSRKQPPAS
jgi:hypothetical protein